MANPLLDPTAPTASSGNPLLDNTVVAPASPADTTNEAFAAGKPVNPSILQRTLKGVKNFEKSPAGKAITQFAALPAEGVNAVLGAPQRVVASALGNAASNAASAKKDYWGTLGRQYGNQIYAAFHPNDPSVQEKAEKAVGVNKLLSTDPRFRGKLQNFAVHTGFQTVTDPLNIAAPGIAAMGEGTLGRIGELGTAALKSENETLRKTAKNMLTNVPEREGGFTPVEIAKANSIKQREITRGRVQHTVDAAILKRNAKALHNGVIPDEVRQRLLGEPFHYGTPQMRAQALLLGYRPTASEMKVAPEELLNYNLKNEYDPHTGMMRQPDSFNDLLLGEQEKLRKPVAGFEEHQANEVAPKFSLYDRISDRLAAGRAAVSHRGSTKSLQEKLGVGPEMADNMTTETKIGGAPILQSISRAQVDALLSTGLPHMRNVGVAGYLAGGEPLLANAARYFVTGVPEKITDRLEQGGASHFGLRELGPKSPARIMDLVPGLRKGTTGMLDRWDQALRAARLQQVDKELKGSDELVKLDRVNQDLGAYNLKPQYVKALQGFLGANFPQWHNYIVPTMVGRALIRNPGRVERLARAEQNANDTFAPNSKYRMTLGGPVDEGASAAADVARILSVKYPSYFGGPSSLGPLSYLFHPPPHETMGQRALEVGAGFVPFGSAILDATANPFKSPLKPSARGAAALAGVYTQKRTPGSLARTRTETPAPTSGNPLLSP